MNPSSILYYKLFLLVAIVVANIVTSIVTSQSSDDHDSWFPDAKADLVRSLPKLSLPEGKSYSTIGHYSGFLEPSSQDTPIHYWFFKSESVHWKSEPMILYLGDYVSAMNGALTGISPIRMNSNGTLSLNEHSWNKRANLLLVESFPEVGFESVNANDQYNRNDTEAVSFVLDVIGKFYDKFSQLKQNDLFVAGEGYVSFLIGILAKEMLLSTEYTNFKGIILGNGFFNMSVTTNSYFQYAYVMKRDLHTSNFWQNLKSCCPKKPCSNWSTADKGCTFEKCQAYTYYNSKETKSETETECKIFYRKYYINLYKTYLNNQKKLLDLHNVYENCVPGVYGATCKRYIITKKIHEWFNENSVRKALHIDEKALRWQPGNKKNYCNFLREYSTLHGHLMFLLSKNIRVLLYSGELDGIISRYNTEWQVGLINIITKLILCPSRLLNDLSLNLVHNGEQDWEFNGKNAGFKLRFCEGLTYYGVSNAGHTVAEDKPAEALDMVNEFIFGEHSANALSPGCRQVAPLCGKFCNTDPSDGKIDAFCDYWMESLARYFSNYEDLPRI